MTAPASASPLEIPPEWERINFSRLTGVVLVVGAPDAGKTTLAQFMFDRLAALGRRVAFLDGDPGQSRLGPPTTITLALDAGDVPPLVPDGRAWRAFIGSTTPNGHMQPMLTGASRLVQASAAEVVVYDTCGLIDPSAGGLALKQALVDLFSPVTVIAIQSRTELEPFLVPLRRSARAEVLTFAPAAAARRRSLTNRQAHRREQYARHFQNAHDLEVHWTRFAVFPMPRFRLNRLVALEGPHGFTRALGIVVGIERDARQITLRTPLASLHGIDAMRLGDVDLNPDTVEDQRLGS